MEKLQNTKEPSRDPERMKYRLSEAMKECMKYAPVEKITVKEIVEVCGTTRQTFYRNFQDKYDLINWYFDKILLKSFEYMGKSETIYEGLVNKFYYIQQENLFFRTAFKNDDQNCLRDHDFHLILQFYTDQIEQKTGEKISEHLRFLLEMYCQGSIYMTVQRVLGKLAGTKFIPVFFVTVACGITSGFHSTQCTLIGRSVEHEKEGRTVFYGMMILEGLIAMIWAAAAMGLYNSGSTAGATAAVGEVAKGLLGPVGGIIAILGVIVLPITSGDTALRSCRLMVADYLHIDQKTRKNRVLVTLGIFIPVILILVFAKMNTEGFNILWRYFAWSNQTIGVFAFAAITIYLMAKKGAKKGIYLIALIPGSFYMFIISSFILSQKIGFGLPMTVAYIIAGVLTALYFAGLIKLGRKYAASHEEE